MLSELSSPRLIITRKRNQRKLKTRSQKFDPAKLQRSLDLSIESSKGGDNSIIKQDKVIQISCLNLNFQRQNQKPQNYQELASSRFRTQKVQMQNDTLRAENQDLKKQLKDLKLLLELKTSDDIKQCQLSVSTITQQAVQEHQGLMVQIDLLKQICQTLRRENYSLRKELDNKQFNLIMIKKRMDYKPKVNLTKLNTNTDLFKNKPCTKCKNFREVKSRNKILNELVLSLSDRLNNFKREDKDEIFELSPN